MGILAVLTALAALLVVLVSRARQKNRFDAQIAALREELRHVIQRVYDLEKAAASRATQTIVSAPEKSESPVPSQEKIAAPPAPRVPTPTVPSPLQPPAARPAQTYVPSDVPPQQRAPQAQALAAGSAAAAPPKAPPPERHRLAEMEERLGANWLNKIGTAAFVIGVALLLNYSMHYLGPRGKICLGFGLSVALLAIGIIAERKERYRIAGRAVLGGGWALAYFTTYAMHNVAAVRLISSPTLGFALLLVVAVAMVAHTLRYNSQVATGFAYLLAFASVGASYIPIGALVAAVLLAASLAVVLRQRHWYALEPFAIVATYALHWMWLHQIYTAMGTHKPFPQFTASVVLLTAYWLVYLVSYFLRSGASPSEVQLLTASFLLNAVGYFIVLHQQSFYPALRFWFLLAAGVIYLGISAFAKLTNRRLSFILASTIGLALLLAAVPYRYSGGSQEILWLIEVEAFLIVGWRLPDRHLRRLGWAGSAVLAGYVFVHDLVPRFAVPHPPNAARAWLLAALAVAFYLNSRLRSRSEEDAAEVDQIAAVASPGIATAFALAAAWIGFSFFWPALLWTFLAILLIELGKYLDDRAFRACAHFSAGFAAWRLLFINLFHTGSWHHISLRLLTVALSCAGFYLCAQRIKPARATEPVAAQDEVAIWRARFAGISGAYSFVATGLLAVLVWHEITTAAVAIAWGLFGLVLLEAARSLRDFSFRLQAYLLLVASFARIFIADLNSTAHVGPIPTPVLTVGLLAAIYYYAAIASADFTRIRAALLWFGAISLLALLRFELLAEWVAVGWAVLAVAFYVLGGRLNSTTFSGQCYVITILVGVRCAFDNFYQTGRWHFTTVRVATVSLTAILLYILFAAAQLAKKHRAAKASLEPDGLWPAIKAAIFNYPQRLFFLIPTLLLTILLTLEVRRGFLTAAWGLEALLIFLIVLKMDERLYRWFSLALFLLCVGRVLTVDVWNLDALGRIVSFLGLGAALLAVSFLYARHREVLRKVL
jgi:uncharacterized membrane protein